MEHLSVVLRQSGRAAVAGVGGGALRARPDRSGGAPRLPAVPERGDGLSAAVSHIAGTTARRRTESPAFCRTLLTLERQLKEDSRFKTGPRSLLILAEPVGQPFRRPL